MDTCNLLFVKLIPLYISILLGFIAGKVFGVQRDAIARLVFYVVAPIVIFNGVLNTKLDTAIISLPLVTFLISCVLSIITYRIARRIWKDSSKNIIAFTAGTGNAGYFGLPIALLIFDQQGEGVYILTFLGMTIFESTLGYVICTRGQTSLSNAIKQALKLPALHALILGLILNSMDFSFGCVFKELMDQMKGTYTVLGMMILGLGLSGLTHFKLDFRFIGLSFFTKFVVWPVIALLVVMLDERFLHWYNEDAYQAFVLMSIVPLSVSTVIIAAVVNAQPEKAALAVTLSTIFALAYVPLMFMFFLSA